MTKSTPERVNILEEASELIVGQRQEDYGTPEVNFQRMADYANIHFKKNLTENIPFSPRQMAEYMILLKMARTINSPTRDSYVDVAGYAGIAGELSQIEAEVESKLESMPAKATPAVPVFEGTTQGIDLTAHVVPRTAPEQMTDKIIDNIKTEIRNRGDLRSWS